MSIESRSRQYGVVFDHWQIKDFLGSGSGGKSAVFRLSRMDSSWGKSALKVINLIEEKGDIDSISDYRRKEYEQAKNECKKSAEQEVLLMDELHGNTNIVDYLDHKFVTWSDEFGFGCDMLIRMELLEDLRGKLRDGCQYSEAEVLKIGRDICTALVLCHGKGILHRDIKPENIFINSDGNFKLGDFGVSRILSSAPTAVASTGIGTPEYAAPEQFTGRHDKRVDIYSLGLVLYELSNGNRLPFASTGYARPMDVQRRQMGEPLPAPCSASRALAEVILKACAYRKEDRYQSAEEFLAALNSLSGYTTPPKPFPAGAGSNATQKAVPAAGGNVIQWAAAADPNATVQAYTDPNATVQARVNPQPARSTGAGPVYSLEKPEPRKKLLIPGLIAAAVLFVVLLLILRKPAECAHEWTPADCTSPKTCAECGETRGDALGHDWMAADCESPKICRICGKVSGEASGHDWMAADCETPKTCGICGKVSGEAPGHTWAEATYNTTAFCTTCGAEDGPKKTPGEPLGLRSIISSVKASSIYSGDNLGRHVPENLYDGRLDTNWTENASGSGIGENVTFYFDDTYAVKKMLIYVGSHFSEAVYRENCRPKVITLTFSDGSTQRVSLEDSYSEQIVTFDQYYYTDSIKLTIEDVYTGSKYPDTVIAELDFTAYRP